MRNYVNQLVFKLSTVIVSQLTSYIYYLLNRLFE